MICKRDVGVFSILVFVGIAVAVTVLLCAGSASSSEPVDSVPGQAEVALYMRDYLERTPEPDERHVQVPELARMIAEESHRVGVDPLLTAVVIRYESGYEIKPGLGVKGKIGEVGLGQLHGLAFHEATEAGCVLDTVRGQVCGAAVFLRFCLELCAGDELGALRAYQGGSCSSKTAGAFLRFRSYLIAQGLVDEAKAVYKRQQKLFAANP